MSEASYFLGHWLTKATEIFSHEKHHSRTPAARKSLIPSPSLYRDCRSQRKGDLLDATQPCTTQPETGMHGTCLFRSTLPPDLGKDQTGMLQEKKKLQTNIPDEHRCKNPQQDTNKINIYHDQLGLILWMQGLFKICRSVNVMHHKARIKIL